MHFSASLTWRTLLLAATLSTAACKHDSDSIDPEGPVVPPTPYVLAPTHLAGRPAPPADNPLTVEGVALGRHLFYEKALSADNTISCGSCHQQAKAFTDGLARSPGVASGRTTRSSMALANLLWEPKLMWDGAASTLEQQARLPIENPNEMHQSLSAAVARLQQTSKYPVLFRKAFGSSTITEDKLLKALAQFERTLISDKSRFDQYLQGDRAVMNSQEIRGMVLFQRHPDPLRGDRGGNCGDCHGGDLQTNRLFSNNGLDATLTDLGQGTITGLPSDNGKFRIPSLRNIGLTAPYMHDGRFASLTEVLDHYNDHIARSSPNLDPVILNGSNNPDQSTVHNLELTAQEKLDIIAFLGTLTDTNFVQDPRFAPPAP